MGKGCAYFWDWMDKETIPPTPKKIKLANGLFPFYHTHTQIDIYNQISIINILAQFYGEALSLPRLQAPIYIARLVSSDCSRNTQNMENKTTCNGFFDANFIHI